MRLRLDYVDEFMFRKINQKNLKNLSPHTDEHYFSYLLFLL